MLTLFVLDGLLLWAAFGVWAILLGACVYKESYSLATFDVVAMVALLSVTGNFHPVAAWDFCIHNPVLIAGCVLGYLVLGVVWARLKWSLLTSKLKDQVDAWKADIKASNERLVREYDKSKADYDRDPTGMRKPSEPEVKTMLNSTIPYELRGKIEVKENGRLAIVFDSFKTRITGWIGYWPMSVIVYVLGDFLHDMLEHVVRLIRSHFTFSADRKLNS